MTLIIAHRGASRAERENTLAAFRAAGGFGADGVELDVRRTADDRLIVHHDTLLANGLLVNEVAGVDLPDHVPSLEAALQACAGMFVNIEIKNDPSEPDFDVSEWVAHRVCGLLADLGTPQRWLLSSFRIETIDRCRALLPSVRTAWLVEKFDDDVIEATVAAGHVAVHPLHSTVTEANLRAAHASGLMVNVWTCDDPNRMRQLMAWGIDGICTNVPDVALAARRSASERG